MANGEVKCSGNPLELKTKYGAGYSLSILFDQKNLEVVNKMIIENIPYGTTKASDKSGNIVLNIPPGERALKSITPMLNVFEKNMQTEEKEGIIKDYTISLACKISTIFKVPQLFKMFLFQLLKNPLKKKVKKKIFKN
jgi:hypothetical protein